MSFVHLHAHSHYSIGRAVPSVRDLVRRAAELRMSAIALTDNNSIAGMGELVEEAQHARIQPIIGCELDILPSKHGLFQGRTHRLTLLVETEQGYRNLINLITVAHQRSNAKTPPHVSFNELIRQSKGMIALSGSPRSELYYWLRKGDPAETKEYLNRLAAGMGPGNLFFEIMEYPHPRIRKVMEYIHELSRFLRIPAVATQNVHFIDPEDMIAYCALVQHNHLLSPRWPLPNEELPTRHFTTQQEMERRFTFLPELLDETLRIAQRCEFVFPRARSRVPLPNYDRGQDPPSLLWDLASRGAASRYGGLSEALKERLNEEFTDLRGTETAEIDLTEFFLLLHDLSIFLAEMGLGRGVGRGNFLTSVIAYALGITQVDPLAYRLDYRSPRQAADRLPLFLMEVSSEGMERSLEFLRDRYGQFNIAAVGKRVDWARQRFFQHLSRWAGLPAVNLKPFAPAKTHPRHEIEPTDETHEPDGLGVDPFAGDWDEEIEAGSASEITQVPLLGEGRIPREKSLRTHAVLAEAVYALHPCPRGFEPERGLYVLSKDPVQTTIPLQRSSSDSMVSQADSEFLARLKMPQIQFTGFPILNILEKAQHFIREEDDPDFSCSSIPLNDEATFRLLAYGLTNGIAPLHGISAKSLLRKTKPENIEDLARLKYMSRRKHLQEDDDFDLVEHLPESLLSYWCAYLKVYHPVSIMAAMLTHALTSIRSSDERPSFQILLRETRKMGIIVLGPDINLSSFEFTQEGKKIRTGLMVVQGIGLRTFEEIAEVRHGMPFSSLADFCHRTDPRQVNHAMVANLIKAGAFDGLGANRSRLLVDLERALKNARRMRSRTPGGNSDQQLQLFDPTIFEQPNEPTSEEIHDIPETPRRDILRFEREAIGYSITCDLIDYFEEMIRTMRAISPYEMTPRMEGRTLYAAGYVDHIEREGILIDDRACMVLDLEGHVVRVPPGLAATMPAVQSASGPVLIQGVVQCEQNECSLLAQKIFLLEEVARTAEEAAVLRIDLTGENTRTLGILRSLLKPYRGTTRVELVNSPKSSWWHTRGISRHGVFYCPPLLDALVQALSADRIGIFDRQGRTLRH